MKTLVLYDSNYGNTKKIAEAIAEELGKQAQVISLSKFSWDELQDITLLVVGSPINGWKPTEKMGKFLNNLKSDQLKGIKAAAFDTRMDVILHGDAMKKISKKLEAAGATIISPPHAFMVTGMNGPLVDGELEKAKAWARSFKIVT